MFKPILLTITFTAALAAYAQTAPSFTTTELGLPAETGYKNVVMKEQPCTQGVDVALEADAYDVEKFMRNCDGTNIGWQSLTINAEDLEYGASDEVTELGLLVSPMGKEISLETCGRNRAQEPGFLPNPPGSTGDAKLNYEILKRAAISKRKIKIDLYFNEWILSGKCIGSIRYLD